MNTTVVSPIRRLFRRAVLVTVVIALVAALAVFVRYPRQVKSYMTHWKGSPTSTRPYAPFPADDRPELRLAVAGDVGDSGSRLTATANAMARLATDDPYDELLLLGDNVYPSGDPARLPATVAAQTIDRQCASGLMATATRQAGDV